MSCRFYVVWGHGYTEGVSRGRKNIWTHLRIPRRRILVRTTLSVALAPLSPGVLEDEGCGLAVAVRDMVEQSGGRDEEEARREASVGKARARDQDASGRGAGCGGAEN